MSTRSLFDAINSKDILTVKSLIQSGTSDVNVQNGDGDTPLHRAVRNEDIEMVRNLINLADCDVNKEDNIDDRPIYTAVNNNYLEIVRCLTARTECDVNVQDFGGNPPLHIAVRRGNIETLTCLINREDCDVNLQDDMNSYTPLHIAVLESRTEFVRSILNHASCDVNIKDIKGYTPLHIAVKEGYIEIVRCLIEHTTCDVNLQDDEDKTPLHIAVLKSRIDFVRSILNHASCDVNIKDRSGKIPLHTAVKEGYIEIVRCLTEHISCDVNLPDPDIDGGTPLRIAVTVAHPCEEIVQCLLDHASCDVNLQDRIECTPLSYAVKRNNIEIVRRFMTHGNNDVNYKIEPNDSMFCRTEGLQTLHKIAKSQDEECFHYLIQHNVDVLTNHADNQLRLAEFILSENDFKSLWFVIQNGLYINCKTSSGENIIHLLAKFYMDFSYIDFNFLFDYELDFDLINNDGNSPLMVASLLNNSPFIQFLAALHCGVNKQNHQGQTALHLCVIGFTWIKEKLNLMKQNSVVKELCAFEYYPRYIACVETLLNIGADVNIQDIDGKTVLMLACIKNDRKLLETLLIGRADVNIVDNHGRSALQYIDLTNNVYDLTCFNLLLSHGCRQSFNQPCLNGNTLIQNVLQFTPLWQVDDTVHFIKFLVLKNVNLQRLTSDDGVSCFGQLSLEEFSSESRHELRQILYLSGGSFVQITQILHFEVEESYDASLPVPSREKPREKFYLFANNLSLGQICRRVIRQNTGLAIHDRISELIELPILAEFLLFKDIDSRPFSLPVQLESFIDDDYEDDYDSYDLNTEHDDYENDYVLYIYCKYLNEVHAGLKR